MRMSGCTSNACISAAARDCVVLKRKRARLHWAMARVYRVRRYGRFWYEDVS